MSNIPENLFDPITFETRHEQEFERSLEAVKLNQQQRRSLCYNVANYSDGKWDGLLDNQPEAHCWAMEDYRRGYLDGVFERHTNRFAIEKS